MAVSHRDLQLNSQRAGWPRMKRGAPCTLRTDPAQYRLKRAGQEAACAADTTYLFSNRLCLLLRAEVEELLEPQT